MLIFTRCARYPLHMRFPRVLRMPAPARLLRSTHQVRLLSLNKNRKQGTFIRSLLSDRTSKHARLLVDIVSRWSL